MEGSRTSQSSVKKALTKDNRGYRCITSCAKYEVKAQGGHLSRLEGLGINAVFVTRVSQINPSGLPHTRLKHSDHPRDSEDLWLSCLMHIEGSSLLNFPSLCSMYRARSRWERRKVLLLE